METLDTVNEILKELLTNAVSAKEFVIGQIPDVLQQLLLFNTVRLGFIVGCGLILMLITVKLSHTLITDRPSKENNSSVGVNRLFDFYSNDCINQPTIKGWYYLFTTLFGGVSGLLLFLSNITELLQIIFAPKIWLLEYTSNLIK